MTFGIRSLDLRHFRSFESLSLEELSGINILMAPNGFGKTNILEALSLFSPGKGLRGADPKDMTQKLHTHPYQVGATLVDAFGSTHMGTTYHITDTQRLKRIFKKEATPLKSQSDLTNLLSMSWLTPAMDRMVSEDSTAQRAFIDRLTFAFHPEHAINRSVYDKLVRERNVILRDHGPTTHALWLDKIEGHIAEKGLDILSARHALLSKLEQKQGTSEAFPNFGLSMQSDVEGIFETPSPLNLYVKELFQRRPQDSKRGITSFGPHRSKLEVTHRGKNITGEFCSTGEQKMLLLAMILAFVKNDFARGVILLLDDVVDHLDIRHRRSLFEEIVETQSKNKLQVWLTGANESPFEWIKDHALCLREHDLMKAAKK